MTPEIKRTSTVWYECLSCGFRSSLGDRRTTCSRCGGPMSNVGVSRE